MKDGINRNMDRVFNINKPVGMTSHDVVYKVRKILGTKKVGHTGTLDPDAQGVLPICVGRATKVSDLILNKDKKYICELTLGVSTDTYDASGKIVSECDCSHLLEEEVLKAIYSYKGEIDQYPPIYSALKVNGKKMCDLARSGRADEIEIKARKVNIKSIDIIDVSLPKVTFEVECSKGTYIRSLCHDIGEKLEVGGHMSYLQRTKSGIFEIDRSITLEELALLKEEGKLLENSYSVESVLIEFPELVLDESAVTYYSNGGKIEERRFIKGDYKNSSSERVRVYTPEKEFIGVGKLTLEDRSLMVKSEKIFKLG